MDNLIGITGGIGAGKSIVSRILRILGYPVYDCDLEARRLMDADNNLHVAVAERLGAHCLDNSGNLCRKVIGEIVFSDDEARNWLNSKVHAVVLQDVKRFGEANAGRNVFVESAILITSGLFRLCSSIWIMEAPVELRVKRVMDRNGLSPENILERIVAQSSEFDFNGIFPDDKIFRIINDTSSPLLDHILSILPPQMR